MSSVDAAAALIAEYNDLRVSNYVGIVASVVFLYECIITVGGEVELFWFAKWTGASVLYLLNRYIVGFYSIYILASSFVQSSQERYVGIKFVRVISVMQYLPWAAFSALRALALSQNWPLATLIFLLSCLPVGVNLAQFHFDLGGVIIPVYDCIGTYDMPPWLMPTRKSILRDGIIYFVSIAILNALHLALTALSTLDTPLENSSLVTYFTEPLTGILVGRFLLHLQAANRKALDLQSSIHSEAHGTATLVFARAVGSLVSSLGPEEDTEYSGDTGDSLIGGSTNYLIKVVSTQIETHRVYQPVTEVLLRDGTIYFITLFIVNSLSMIFSSLGSRGCLWQLDNLMITTIPNILRPPLSSRLTASLILRFLIHIQSVNQQVNDEDLDTTQGGSGVQIRSLLFERVVGSIGSSLDPSFDDYDDEGGGTVKGRDTSTSDYDLSSRSAPPDEDDTKEAPDHVAAVGLLELSQSRSQEGIQSQLA
ncbi:hypothetical protein C8T65DRAFT_750688 [Cerioporus squamosus]|nr:hypothetical protein C8T65DRAFT_750688 [Cerioporus squamosus]